jgi:HlyD family secretion protein
MKRIFAVAPVIALPLAWWVVDVPVVHSAAQHLTAAVEEGELRRIVTTTGTLNAIVNVEVGSQLSGQVAELLVDFNDEVRKGQPLACLDQRSFQARVTEAHAAMEVAHVAIEVAKAKLERARIDAEDARAQRPVLDARIDSARVKLEAARSELKRKEALRERSIGTTVDVEDAQTKVRSAEAALREAQAIATAQENKAQGRRPISSASGPSLTPPSRPCRKNGRYSRSPRST